MVTRLEKAIQGVKTIRTFKKRYVELYKKFLSAQRVIKYYANDRLYHPVQGDYGADFPILLEDGKRARNWIKRNKES